MKNREIPFKAQYRYGFQDFRLLNDRNVFENVAFSLRVIRTPPRNSQKCPLTLDSSGLKDKAYKLPHELSGGEQQRVCVARAIVNRPAVLLMADEPTGNLDPVTAKEIMTLIQDINIRGTTMIVATHAKDLVDQFQKRVVVLENNQLVGDQERGFILMHIKSLLDFLWRRRLRVSFVTVG